MRLAYPAARAVSALPDSYVTLELLKGVCADGFDGQDSGRYDQRAVDAIDQASRDRTVPIGISSTAATSS